MANMPFPTILCVLVRAPVDGKRRRNWEKRLRAEGLGMSAGRSPRLVYASRRLEALEEHWVHRSHGLVSSVYDQAASGDYIPAEEARRRNREALKTCIAKYGFYETKVRIKGADLPERQEPARQNLLSLLSTLEP